MEQGAELFGTIYRRGDIVFRQGDPGDSHVHHSVRGGGGVSA